MSRFASRLVWLACALAAAVWAQPQTALTCGAVVSSTLPGTGVGMFGVTVQKGDLILVRVLATDSNTSFAITGVKVVDATNRQIASQGAFQIGASFAAEYAMDLTGTFTIEVTASTIGNFSIVYTTLNRPCNAASLNCGVSALGQITAPLQLAAYQFPVNAGDVVEALVGQFQPYAKGFSVAAFAYDPNGQILIQTDGKSPAAVTTGGSGFTNMVFPVSTAGVITIVVFDSANLTGNYGLSVFKLTGACNNTKNLTCGALSQGTVVSPLGVDSYGIAAQAGDVINLRTASVGTDGSFVPRAAVFDPQGNQVIAIQSATTGGHASSAGTFTAKLNGSYLVFVSDVATGLNTGSYVLGFTRLNRPCSSETGLTCSSLVNGSINGLLASNLYTLPASAGDNYFLRVLRTDQSGSAFRPRVDIYDPSGNAVQFLSTANLAQTTFTTSTSGAYTLMVTDGTDNSQTGTYSLGLVRLNRPCGAGTLNCGAVSSAAFTTPLTTAVYSYNANPGESFSVRMLDVNGTLQPGLAVYDPNGNPVGQTISGNFTGIDVPQPAGGAYTVVATDNTSVPTGGPFEVDLLRTVNACGSTPPQGGTTQAVISGAQPFQSYSIPASAGDSLLVRSTAFSNGFTALMELYDPTGARLNASTYSLTRSPAVAGNYTVIVGPSAPRTSGAYALSWQLLNNPAGAVGALTCGGSTTASLSLDNQFHYYQAPANAGDLMRMIFTPLASAFSPSIELYDPTGVKLASSPSISQKAAVSGNFLVIVGPSSSIGQTGSFTVAYQRPNNPCSPTALTCGQVTLRQVNLPGQVDTYTFAGTAGNVSDLRLTPRSGNYSPYAELYDSTGALRGTSASGTLLITPPANATYSLLVRDLSANLGSYRVGLQNDTSACPATDTEPPVVTLLKPVGGEVIMGGSTYQIQWQSDDNVGVTSQAVDLSTDGGKTFATSIAAGLSGNQQSYTWIVPASIPPSRTAVVRITATDAAGNSQTAVSGPLSIIGSGFSANSNVSYAYDGLNRITTATLGDGRVVTYTWDLAGNLISVSVAGQ